MIADHDSAEVVRLEPPIVDLVVRDLHGLIVHLARSSVRCRRANETAYRRDSTHQSSTDTPVNPNRAPSVVLLVICTSNTALSKTHRMNRYEILITIKYPVLSSERLPVHEGEGQETGSNLRPDSCRPLMNGDQRENGQLFGSVPLLLLLNFAFASRRSVTESTTAMPRQWSRTCLISVEKTRIRTA